MLYHVIYIYATPPKTYLFWAYMCQIIKYRWYIKGLLKTN